MDLLYAQIAAMKAKRAALTKQPEAAAAVQTVKWVQKGELE